MKPNVILALDVGNRRIGVARGYTDVGIATPVTTIEQSDDIMQQIQRLVADNSADLVLVGLPRGLEGQETEQTKIVRQFVRQLKKHLKTPIALLDEALTSVKAEQELLARGKAYQKSDIDALAATYILEDYLASHMDRRA